MENTTDVNTPLPAGPPSQTAVILAGDIGATNTRLGLFDAQGDRPRQVHGRDFPTTSFEALTDIVTTYLAGAPPSGGAIATACFGVAGPVLGTTAQLTNVPFAIDATAVGRVCGTSRVALLNDLQAMAFAVPALRPDELHELQPGNSAMNGNMALIAAGTGLGQAVLHRVGGRFIPVASEAGHADWAARSERDVAVWRSLVARYGRAEVEHVISGIGLANLHRAMHTGRCDAGIDPDDADSPAAVTKATGPVSGAAPTFSGAVTVPTVMLLF